MPIRRRDLLLGGAALAACRTPEGTEPPTPAPARSASPAAPEPEVPVDPVRFPWGVVVTDPLAGSALVRVFARETDRVMLHLQRHDGEAWVDAGVQELARDGATHPGTLTGLTADTVYAVWAAVEGVRSDVTRFRTAPFGVPRRRIRLGATSCLNFSNPGMRNLTHVAEHDVDLFLMLGDAVYADGSRTVEGYRTSWEEHFVRPAMGELFAASAILSVWDDHEVDNNWTLDPASSNAVSEATLRSARQVMDEFLPQRAGPDGYYRTHRWGEDVEFFLLDCRGERGEDRMVSDAQLAFVIERLQASTARFKIVLSSVHLTDHQALFSTIEAADRWQGVPAQRAELVATLANVPGTLVLTGDMHFGSVQQLDPEGPGAAVWEIAAGPSGSFLAPVGVLIELLDGIPPQYAVVLEDWSWTLLDLDPSTGEVHARFIGNDGTTLAEHTLIVPLEARP